MRDFDDARLEILRIARELVVGEYNNRRAETHNQWLVESDRLWKASRVRLAYPPIPPFPTEADILLRAQSLMEFVGIGKSEQAPQEPAVDNTVVDTSDDALPSVLKRIEEMRHRLEDSIQSGDDQV